MNDLNNSRMQSYSAWLQGISGELNSWHRSLARQLPEGRPAFEFIFPELLTEYGIHTKILEVGCGPQGGCGQLLQGEPLRNLHCCDPLAPAYNELYKLLHYSAPGTIEFAFAERLTSRYESNYFDVVVMKNALDHSFDPIWAVLEMLSVLKPGGVMKLEHVENEAEIQKYNNLHQWNIDQSPDNELIIWNKNGKQNMTLLLKDIATVTVKKYFRGGHDWILATLVKHTDFSTQDINDSSSASFLSFGQFQPPFTTYDELIFTELTHCKLRNNLLSNKNKTYRDRETERQRDRETERQRDREQYLHQVHNERARNQRLKKTISWRITAPLRIVRRLVKGKMDKKP